MKQRCWDGHIRELGNFIERIVTVSPADAVTIDPSFFPMELHKELEDYRLKMKVPVKLEPIKEQLEKYEADIIRKALIECDWNQSQAARKLQTSESNIRYKMGLFKIQRDEQS